jgi:hypothetical protein
LQAIRRRFFEHPLRIAGWLCLQTTEPLLFIQCVNQLS